MRDIKFRLWNTITKEISSFDKIKKAGVFALDIGLNCDDFIVLPLRNTIITQYTGLKDKNGVEIYKSDLLKDDKGRVFKAIEDNRIGATGYIMECVKNKSEKDHIKAGNIYNFYSWITPFHCLEVIGNIYENPELLN